MKGRSPVATGGQLDPIAHGEILAGSELKVRRRGAGDSDRTVTRRRDGVPRNVREIVEGGVSDFPGHKGGRAGWSRVMSVTREIIEYATIKTQVDNQSVGHVGEGGREADR